LPIVAQSWLLFAFLLFVLKLNTVLARPSVLLRLENLVLLNHNEDARLVSDDDCALLSAEASLPPESTCPDNEINQTHAVLWLSWSPQTTDELYHSAEQEGRPIPNDATA
jgi:hypothetical protein